MGEIGEEVRIDRVNIITREGTVSVYERPRLQRTRERERGTGKVKGREGGRERGGGRGRDGGREGELRRERERAVGKCN